MRKLGWIAAVILEVAVFTLLAGRNFSSGAEFATYFRSYFADLLGQAGPILLLGFGMTIILMTAGIDLSVASMVALISCVMGKFNGGPQFWYTAVPAGLLTGLALGFLNGFLISRADVPPIIATLGTMIFYRGLCYVLLGDLERSPFVELPGYDWFGNFTGASVLVALIFVVGGQYFLHSRWRHETLMIGGNRIAARYAAIPVERRLIQAYTLMGLLSFLAALCFTSRNSAVSASSFSGMELHVIVAVVLGGTKVQGGEGSLLGTFFGVLLIAILDEGLRGAAIWGDRHLPFKISHLEYIFLGALLGGGVWLNTWFQRREKL
jgi:ribose/xylose/arabinose/galactoside ABC-type transport system permease subunit